MATYSICLTQGIGNMVQTTPFMNWLRDRGHRVEVYLKQVDHKDMVKLVDCAFDKVEQNPSKTGTVHRKDIWRHGNLKKFMCVHGEWAAWFEWYGLAVPDVDEVFASVNYVQPKKQFDVVLAPCCKPNWPMKKWPYWQQLIDAWPGCAVVGLAGDGGDLHGDFTDLRGKLSLLETAGQLKFAQAVVAQDSGPAHMACAAGTKTIILAGPTDMVKCRPPHNAIVIKEPGICSSMPCQYRGGRVCRTEKKGGQTIWWGCQYQQTAPCMAAIPMDDVYCRLEQLMEEQ